MHKKMSVLKIKQEVFKFDLVARWQRTWKMAPSKQMRPTDW